MDKTSSYTAKRGYIVDAFYRWITANQLTALVVIDIQAPNLKAPTQYAKQGMLTLDISDDAVDNLSILPTAIHATCYFDEGPETVYIPMHSVVGIYAGETMDGYSFDHDPEENELLIEEERILNKTQNPSASKSSGRAHLKLVKNPSDNIS